MNNNNVTNKIIMKFYSNNVKIYLHIYQQLLWQKTELKTFVSQKV